MAASKGHRKAGGRAKGIPNKITADIRQRIAWIIDNNYEQVLKDFATLPPEKRVEMWIRLLDFVTPKMQRTEVEQETTIMNVPSIPVIHIEFRE